MTANLPHVLSPPFVPAPREDKFIGQDGAFWPLARKAMADSAAIRRRMAEDLRDILRDRGGDGLRSRDPFTPVTTDDLVYRGWSRDQVLSHGDAAMAAVEAAEDVREA